ncbi:unnamed protein product, partial [Ascophyllum nodosum]
MEMNRLTRDGTAEPVSRDQILRQLRAVILYPITRAKRSSDSIAFSTK